MDFRLNRLGYIFQEYALIAELTALENVMLPAMMLESYKNAKKRAKGMLTKIGLDHKYNRLPSQLSGGEQQKVAIARALINHPKIIFADEPTANLDSTASVDVLEIFKSLNEKEGITIVMITHEPEELVYANRIIQLSDGKIT
jgi:putative ABC transport system ATP-binding protein